MLPRIGNFPKHTGQDAHTVGLDKFSGADVNGFSLGYYKDDYTPILGTNAFASTDYLMDANGAYGELFNGNISTMVTAMKDENEVQLTTQGNIYQYDLLQRIKSMKTYQVTDATNYNATNAFAAANASNTGKYATTYGFDKNGNLDYLTRKDDAGILMDDFEYEYHPTLINRLDYVAEDGITTAGTTVTSDIKEGQVTGNYVYDEIGQLIKDVQEGIEEIEWTADGKVRRITFTTGHGGEPIEYIYGAGGNRLVQITGVPNQPGTDYEYYVYDVGGNLMATYTKTMGGNLPGTAPADYTETTTLKDRNIYGATRLGSKHENKALYSRHFNVTGGDFVAGQTTVSTEIHVDYFDKEKRRLGSKYYEMTNHLNNVLNVVSDRKLPNVTMTGYEANVVSYSDYYPYGMLLDGRNGGENSYRYSFQGQEHDDDIRDVKGGSINYKYRMHDPRIGRFFAVDPLAGKYPHNSVYAFSENRLLDGVELEGLEYTSETGKFYGAGDEEAYQNEVVNEKSPGSSHGSSTNGAESITASAPSSPTGVAPHVDPYAGWKIEPYEKLPYDGNFFQNMNTLYMNSLGANTLNYGIGLWNSAVSLWTGERTLAEDWNMAVDQTTQIYNHVTSAEAWKWNPSYYTKWENWELPFATVTTGFAFRGSSFMSPGNSYSVPKKSLNPYKRGQTFTGVHNINTGQSFLYKNWHNNSPPLGYLPRNRSHVKFANHLVNKGYGVNRTDFVGFTAQKKRFNSLKVISYNSASLNRAFHGEINYSVNFSREIKLGLKNRYDVWIIR